MHRPQCVGGVLQGLCGLSCQPHQTGASLRQSGFPIRLRPSQGIGWVSPIRQGQGWFEALPIRPRAPHARSLSSLVFNLGIISGAQPQPVLVGPSKARD